MFYTPLPGEYIASVIKRGNETLGIKGISRDNYLIIKTATTSRRRDGEIIFPQLFKDHGVTEEVLYENTLYPLTAALGRIHAGTIYTPMTRWKICLDCVTTDLALHGTAYIHCRNLPSSVFVCSIHGSRLYEKCPTCSKSITAHSIGELSKCGNNFPKPEKKLNIPIHQYSIFISELLSYEGEAFTPRAVESVFARWRTTTSIVQHNQSSRREVWENHMSNLLETHLKRSHILSVEACAATAFFTFTKAKKYFSAIEEHVKSSKHRYWNNYLKLLRDNAEKSANPYKSGNFKL
ncbi:MULTISPECIES: hypothetical protein [unclassified Pseudomonas]|uniref:hypothetical protein n=1 Tax=unclassified Pseudomonas TaxID=196821 RepID=UPI0011AEE195|nr:MULTISPECIES: hypothetical protein [unclassified Pseudomonas]